MAKIDIDKQELMLETKKYEKVILEQQLEKQPDDIERTIIQGKIYALDKDILKISEEVRVERAEEDYKRNTKFWTTDRVLVAEAITNNHIGYLIPDNKLIYCKDFGLNQSNANFETIEVTNKKIVRFFEKLCNAKLKGADEDRILDLITAMNRSYLKQTSSFNNDRWNDVHVYNQSRIIMNFWNPPDFVNSADYNRDFDILMYSVGGGKKENIDHLEQWLAYKFLRPERVANTPNLDLGGQPGGNGKGRYVKLCETIFTPVCVIEAAAKEINAGFNSNWANAVVLHYDEPEENELANSKIKNATGGESQRIERKGVDAYIADRNYSIVFTSNNENGVVVLSGNKTGEDRRFSVISTNIVMTDYIMKTENINIDQAKDRVNAIAQLVKDNKEVSRWLAHIILKHQVNDIEVLQPLHGIDYNNRFNDQKSNITNAFDAILPIVQQEGFIPTNLLLELVHVLTDNDNYKTISVNKQFQNYLKNKQIAYTVNRAIRIDYKWNGVDIEEHVTKNKRTTVIAVREVGFAEEFNYNLVSSAKRILSFETHLTRDNCILQCA
jgi:hypothetical protein